MQRSPYEIVQAVQENIEKVFYGKPEVVQGVLVGLISGGHVLIEDVPGVGKTLLARALARTIDCSFQRIQFTPDLLPSDVIGVSVYDSRSGEFVFKPGPIFANIVLADEINRTPPRTQSSLLEAMNDRQVTVDRKTYPLPEPFMVLATQNPHEFEGTYPLPESQLDRFFLHLHIGYPERGEEMRILRDYMTTRRAEELKPVVSIAEVMELQRAASAVSLSDDVYNYLMDIIEFTRRCDDLLCGASPRAGLALMRAAQSLALTHGRDYCLPDDVKQMVHPVLEHRLLVRGGSASSRDGGPNAVIEEILNSVRVPQ